MFTNYRAQCDHAVAGIWDGRSRHPSTGIYLYIIVLEFINIVLQTTDSRDDHDDDHGVDETCLDDDDDSDDDNDDDVQVCMVPIAH